MSVPGLPRTGRMASSAPGRPVCAVPRLRPVPAVGGCFGWTGDRTKINETEIVPKQFGLHYGVTRSNQANAEAAQITRRSSLSSMSV